MITRVSKFKKLAEHQLDTLAMPSPVSCISHLLWARLDSVTHMWSSTYGGILTANPVLLSLGINRSLAWIDKG